MSRGRKQLLAGTAVAVAVAVGASGAVACTVFRGKFKVTGNASTTPVIVVGNNQNMRWCAGFPKGVAQASRDAGSFTVVVKPAPSKCGAHKLPKGTYNINFANGVAHTGTDHRIVIDCMGDGGGGAVNLGTVFVNRYGEGGPKSFTLASGLVPNGPSDESGVCISDPGGLYGNQAPITII